MAYGGDEQDYKCIFWSKLGQIHFLKNFKNWNRFQWALGAEPCKKHGKLELEQACLPTSLVGQAERPTAEEWRTERNMFEPGL